MKKFFLLLMMPAVMLASCSKSDDEPKNDEGVKVEDLVGTWTFQNPAAADIVVTGTQAKSVEAVKSDFTSKIAEGTLIQPIDVTFSKDLTCKGISTDAKGSVHNYAGTFKIVDGRLRVVFSGTERAVFSGMLEKKGNEIFLIRDKQSELDDFDFKATAPEVSEIEKQMFTMLKNAFTANITDVRCPLKMVKK